MRPIDLTELRNILLEEMTSIGTLCTLKDANRALRLFLVVLESKASKGYTIYLDEDNHLNISSEGNRWHVCEKSAYGFIRACVRLVWDSVMFHDYIGVHGLTLEDIEKF